MNMYKLLYFLPLLFFISCKHKSDDPAPVLSKQWYSYKAFSNDTVKVMDGYLYMSTKYGSGSMSTGATSLNTFKRLKGDFELRIKFSNVSLTGNELSETLDFALFQDGANPAVLTGGISNQIFFISDGSTFPDIESRTSNEGEFYVKRVGGDYTTWIRVGDKTAYYNTTNYVTADLGVSIVIFSDDETATRTSVHVDDVSITGGGGNVVSDSFNRNNIMPF